MSLNENVLERIDKILVRLDLVVTRSQASLLIKEGVVFCNDRQVKKGSKLVSMDDVFRIEKIVYAGRGGDKLKGALLNFDLNVEGSIVADIGASTGGFSDLLLSLGANRIYAIDVGHGQLVERLKSDSRIINMEGVNIRDKLELPELVDLAVVDLSFISIKYCLKNIFALLKSGGKVISLIKPQFEVGKGNLGKNGVVKDFAIRESTVNNLAKWCNDNSFYVLDRIESPITGKSGNVEYFFYLEKRSEQGELF